MTKTLRVIAVLVILATAAAFNVDVTIAPPIDAARKSLSFQDLNLSTKRELTCLADNIYYEARGEPDIGKTAVAYVTINRLIDGSWSNTICGVVQQKIKGTCQFSWICDGQATRTKMNYALYEKCRKIAFDVYLNYAPEDDVTNGSTFYHTTEVNPKWRNVTFVKDIYNHRFYRANNRA